LPLRIRRQKVHCARAFLRDFSLAPSIGLKCGFAPSNQRGALDPAAGPGTRRFAMSISSVGSNAPAQVDPSNQSSVIMAKKALDQQKQQGANVLALIQSAAPSSPGAGKKVSTFA
jgi:hypothetical protein